MSIRRQVTTYPSRLRRGYSPNKTVRAQALANNYHMNISMTEIYPCLSIFPVDTSKDFSNSPASQNKYPLLWSFQRRVDL